MRAGPIVQTITARIWVRLRDVVTTRALVGAVVEWASRIVIAKDANIGSWVLTRIASKDRMIRIANLFCGLGTIA